MMKRFGVFLSVLFCLVTWSSSFAADVEPLVIEQPGTQKNEVGNLESPDKCDNCHGGYNTAVEPAFLWRGSGMGNAGRDPIFWATLAIAEQDFDGSGDLCIRCHSTAGWYGGRSTPTDGSGLAAADDDGVDCDTCHHMTNPDNSEHLGVQVPPYVANDPATGEGYYGTGMLSLWGGADKLGPYSDAEARHQFMPSSFHRSADFCGTCHDVSNPAVGNLAPDNGKQETGADVVADGALDGVVDTKAAFNNLPYMYGIVERTFSEYKSSAFATTTTPVSEYPNLPLELQGGALKASYESAIIAGTGGNYEDGTTRYFTCQTCHMRPVTGEGANKNGVPVRKDLPLHDLTGGNYWLPDVIRYQNTQGHLRLGGNLTTVQLDALEAGKTRAMKQLSEAVSLQVSGDTLKVINQTGHKVISGYPEGRRMWLRITWKDDAGTELRVDGEYGPLKDANGQPVMVVNPANPAQMVQVDSIQDLYGANTKIYEAHYGITNAWANTLMDVNPDVYGPIVLGYDRYTGAAGMTIGELAADASVDFHKSFHFVLNNHVDMDNRIPPYGMNYDEAVKRNVLPVPADQYGNPGPGGVYNHWDEMTLAPPAGATYALIEMLYQSTSWEYIQFLERGNNGQNTFLADEGKNMLEAWLNTGMAKPYVMATAEWGEQATPPALTMSADSMTTWSISRKGAETQTAIFSPGDTVTFKVHVVDEAGSALSGVQVFVAVAPAGVSLQGFTDESGTAVLAWKTGRKEAGGSYTATVVDLLKNGYQVDAAVLGASVTFSLQ